MWLKGLRHEVDIFLISTFCMCAVGFQKFSIAYSCDIGENQPACTEIIMWFLEQSIKLAKS
jgi:hypothetical protein